MGVRGQDWRRHTTVRFYVHRATARDRHLQLEGDKPAAAAGRAYHNSPVRQAVSNRKPRPLQGSLPTSLSAQLLNETTKAAKQVRMLWVQSMPHFETPMCVVEEMMGDERRITRATSSSKEAKAVDDCDTCKRLQRCYSSRVPCPRSRRAGPVVAYHQQWWHILQGDKTTQDTQRHGTAGSNTPTPKRHFTPLHINLNFDVNRGPHLYGNGVDSDVLLDGVHQNLGLGVAVFPCSIQR